MKKLISLALCLALILGLAACGGSDFENAMTKAQAASAELKSMHVDMDTVSYTHLDVYKRQGRRGRCGHRTAWVGDGTKDLSLIHI